MVDALARQGGAASAGKDGDAVVVAGLDDGLNVLVGAWNDYTHWFHLVDGSVGRVQYFGVCVEADLAGDMALQLFHESLVLCN